MTSAFVADGGIGVSSAGAIPVDKARGTRDANVWVAPSGANLADLVSRIDAGRLQLHIADRRPLAELPAVHTASGTGTLAGKTVILIA